MGRNPQTDALEPLDFNHLKEQVYELAYVKTGIDVYQFSTPIDSSDMDPKAWAMLVSIIAEQYDNYDGFVILHGTDTMAYTASALSYMLENLTKPVILTGSQLPIGQLRPEVCIYFSGNLLRGNRSTKQNAEGFSAFESFNYPHLCDAGVNFAYHEHHILQPDYSRPMIPHYDMNPNVAVFSLFPGIQENIVRHMLDAPELRGIVMRTYGSGNAPQKPWIMRLLKEACERGVIIVNISQCVAGCVEMGLYDAGFRLKQVGVISGYDGTVESAVTKLMYLQARYNDPATIRSWMNRSRAGEITVE